MTPELQSVLDRLDDAERRNRGLQALSVIAMLLSVTVGAYAYLTTLARPAPRATPGVVEATRFLLRDETGTVRGGLEVERGGTVKLVVGNQDGHMGAAVILAQPTGLVQVQLRSPSGVVRGALNGGIEPSLVLTSDDGASSAALLTKSGSRGQLLLSDRTGQLVPGP